jgi:hypothetical protein
MLMGQNYKNHVRYVPVFHFFVLPVLAANFVWSVHFVRQDFSATTVIGSLTALALVLGALFGRMFALTVQNRVIR